MEVYSYFKKEFNTSISRGGLYFHGEVEEKAGYDIPQCSSFDIDELEEGVYDVLYNGYLPCRMFFWRSEHWLRGYIISVDDLENLDFAEDKFKKKSNSL